MNDMIIKNTPIVIELNLFIFACLKVAIKNAIIAK